MPNDDVLKAAKAALANANKKFPTPSSSMPKAAPPKPARMPNADAPMSSPNNRAAVKAQNQRAVSDVANAVGLKGTGTIGSFHKGGTVPKDGAYNLKAGETVLPTHEQGDVSGTGDASGDKPAIPSGMRSRTQCNANCYYLPTGEVAPEFETDYDRMPAMNKGERGNPAFSKAQRRLMGLAEHDPSAVSAKNRGVLKMSHEQLHDFAATKEKGLPARKSKKK